MDGLSLPAVKRRGYFQASVHRSNAAVSGLESGAQRGSSQCRLSPLTHKLRPHHAWHPAANRRFVFTSRTSSGGRLAHLRWIRLRKHARNFHGRIFGAPRFPAARQRPASQRSRSALPSRSASAATSPPTVSGDASTRRKFSIALSSSIRRARQELPRERASFRSFARTPQSPHAPSSSPHAPPRANTAQRSPVIRTTCPLFHVCRKPLPDWVSRENNPVGLRPHPARSTRVYQMGHVKIVITATSSA